MVRSRKSLFVTVVGVVFVILANSVWRASFLCLRNIFLDRTGVQTSGLGCEEAVEELDEDESVVWVLGSFGVGDGWFEIDRFFDARVWFVWSGCFDIGRASGVGVGVVASSDHVWVTIK